MPGLSCRVVHPAEISQFTAEQQTRHLLGCSVVPRCQTGNTSWQVGSRDMGRLARCPGRFALDKGGSWALSLGPGTVQNLLSRQESGSSPCMDGEDAAPIFGVPLDSELGIASLLRVVLGLSFAWIYPLLVSIIGTPPCTWQSKVPAPSSLQHS